MHKAIRTMQEAI